MAKVQLWAFWMGMYASYSHVILILNTSFDNILITVHTLYLQNVARARLTAGIGYSSPMSSFHSSGFFLMNACMRS